MVLGTFTLVGIVTILVAYTNANEQQAGPSFLVMPTLVQADTGGTVELSCAINNLGFRHVAWYKYRLGTVAEGTQILSIVGGQRLSAELDMDLENHITFYNLTISGVIDDDAGLYRCVISTDDEDDNDDGDIESLYIRVIVGDIIDDASTGLSGTHYVEMNGLILLTCLNPTGGTYIPDWYRNGDHITESYDPHVQLQNWEAEANRGAASAIIIQNARILDGGTYVCRGTGPGNRVFIDSLKVMVLTPGFWTQYDLNRGYR